VAEGRANLLIDCHHLITDGGSFDLIMREIVDRLDGRDVEAETYSYMQFAADQKSRRDGQEYAEAKAFFDTQLCGCEGASEITADMPKNSEAVSSLRSTLWQRNSA
jgi:hypothetical protein